MGIENLKRWHWIVIGIIVGLAIAYANTNMEPTEPPSLQLPQFMRDVTLDDLPGDLPRIKDIVVNPPTPASETAYHKPLQLVTFKLANYDRARRGWVYTPMAMEVDLPFHPTDAPAGKTDSSFANYLQTLQTEYPFITYQYAWWKAPDAQYGLWVLGCVVVIGGIWPTIQNLLIGAGLGPSKKKEPAYDLNRFGKYKEAETKPAEKKKVSAADQDQLDKLTQSLESELAPSGGAMRVGVDPNTNTDRPASDQPIRKLDSKPLEIANIEQEEEEKEYKGEFYPVAKPAPKKE